MNVKGRVVKMIRLGLIRHGETDWNKMQKMQGQQDVPLNETGLKQAEAIAERLRHESWDVIYSSDLLRAKRTAELIAEAMGKTVYDTDTRLRERSFGQYEGRSFAERQHLIHPSGSEEAERLWGIESDETLRGRALSFLTELERKDAGRNILLVSHGGWIKALIAALCTDEAVTSIGNTSISILQFDRDVWNLELCNCTRHLGSYT